MFCTFTTQPVSMVLPPDLKPRAKDDRKRFKKFFARLKRRTPKDLDQQVQLLHADAFSQMDCLECANCCKTTSPIFRDIDIERISQHLGQRPSAFIEQYLYLDTEGDYVLCQAPCPFLGADNYCSIYEVRPRACRDYPHTDRKNFHQLFSLTLKNTEICPATYWIVQQLEKVYT